VVTTLVDVTYNAAKELGDNVRLGAELVANDLRVLERTHLASRVAKVEKHISVHYLLS
jgi:hypothetical protein